MLKTRRPGWRRAILPLLAVALLGGPSIPLASAQSLDAWQPGPEAQGTSTFAGNIDEPTPNANVTTGNAFTVRGWVVDKTAQGWTGIVEVQVYEGLPGQGGTLISNAQIQQSRPDVSAAFGYPYWEPAGFAMTVPANRLGAGSRTLTVLARTAAKGWWYRQVTVNVSEGPSFASDPLLVIQKPTEAERVSTVGEYTISGYAVDRNAPSGTGVDRVELYLDYPKGDPRAIFLGEARLNVENGTSAQFGTRFNKGGWEFTFSPTKYASDNHNLYVYARSTVTRKERQASVFITIYDPT